MLPQWLDQNKHLGTTNCSGMREEYQPTFSSEVLPVPAMVDHTQRFERDAPGTVSGTPPFSRSCNTVLHLQFFPAYMPLPVRMKGRQGVVRHKTALICALATKQCRARHKIQEQNNVHQLVECRRLLARLSWLRSRHGANYCVSLLRFSRLLETCHAGHNALRPRLRLGHVVLQPYLRGSGLSVRK